MNPDFQAGITVIDRTKRTPDKSPIGHAKIALFEALKASSAPLEVVAHMAESDFETPGMLIGKTTDQLIKKFISTPISSPESIVIEWAPTDQAPLLVIAGSDERGLAYALYEITDRITTRGITDLENVKSLTEQPDNPIRGVDKLIMGPISDEWLFDLEFWEYYLQRLVKNRFNRLVLITGYDTAYLSPPYPFVVEVENYPAVEVLEEFSVPSRESHRNLLRTIGNLCTEYGLEFYLGIWQQRPDWRESQGAVVEGLPNNPGEFTSYCSLGLERLLTEIPEIDGIQLRINYEAGVGGSSYDSGSGIGPTSTTAEEFWYEIIDAINRAAEQRTNELTLDLRAKGLTDGLLEHAFRTGLNITIPTKYWTESTGLPYHMTQMRREELEQLYDLNRMRRYGYSNLLKKPRNFDLLYRLWVVGTNRIFVWGDPDYARRFAKSTQFGDAIGFEVTAPLGLKGRHLVLQESPWSLFADPSLRDYEWEDERYWAWYRLFGLYGYSTETTNDFWERALEQRFGEAASALDSAYRAASKVLPLITAAHLTEHPALQNWAELDTGGALFPEHNVNQKFGNTEYYDGSYQDVEPSDPGLFYGINEFVADYRNDELSNKYTPIQVQEWYRSLACEIRESIKRAKQQIANQTGEFKSTVLDFEMLADLAEYHAEKTMAALALSLYKSDTHNSELILTAFNRLKAAKLNWESLAERGNGTYHGNLVFGLGEESAHAGQWENRLPELTQDLETLHSLIQEEELKENHNIPSLYETFTTNDHDSVVRAYQMDVPDTWEPGSPLPIRVNVGGLVSPERITVHYRTTDQTQGEFETAIMDQSGDQFQFNIPSSYLDESWNIQVYCSVKNAAGTTVIIPGIYDAVAYAPYYVIELSTE